MKIEIYDTTGKKTDKKADLNSGIWSVPMNKDLVAQVIRVYLDNQRKGTAHSKTRAEVRGGGRKPWRQKGTGRARHGSIRSPIWTKGGVAFGPRAYKKYKRIPKKMNKLAMKCVLSDKAASKSIVVIAGFPVEKVPSVKKMTGFLTKLGIDQSKNLIILSNDTKNSKVLLLSIKNLARNVMKRVKDINVYDVVNSQSLVLADGSVKDIEERLS